MDEREKWERRYLDADSPFYGGDPSPFLVRSVPLLPAPGRCLDLGGGEGRNAIFLARCGWDVTMLDVALPGLARARGLARAAGVSLRMAAADLRTPPLRGLHGHFDLVLAINYHSREMIREACGWLRPGGALLVEGFAPEQLGRGSGGPPCLHHLWKPNELLQRVMAPGDPARHEAPLRVVWYEDRLAEGDDNPRHRGAKWVVRLVARRLA